MSRPDDTAGARPPASAGRPRAPAGRQELRHGAGAASGGNRGADRLSRDRRSRRVSISIGPRRGKTSGSRVPDLLRQVSGSARHVRAWTRRGRSAYGPRWRGPRTRRCRPLNACSRGLVSSRRLMITLRSERGADSVGQDEASAQVTPEGAGVHCPRPAGSADEHRAGRGSCCASHRPAAAGPQRLDGHDLAATSPRCA